MTHRRSRATGFSLIELLTALALLGVLGGVALPVLRSAVDRADATKVMTDMTAVRQALFAYREDTGQLPRSNRWGVLPPELQPYLDAVAFTYKDLDYRLRVSARRGRVELWVRYPRGSRLGAALQRFRRAGQDAGSVTWSSRRTTFRLLEANR